MKRFKQLFRYLRPYSAYAVLNVVCNILVVLFSLVSLTMIIPFLRILFGKADLVTQKPIFNGFSVQSILAQFDYFVSHIIITQGKAQALAIVCLTVTIFFLFKNVFRWLAIYVLAPLRNGVNRDLRNDLYHKILHLPIAYFNNERKGDLMARTTTDVAEIENSIFSFLENLIKDPIEIIAFVSAMLYYSPRLTLIVFIVLPISGFIIGTVGKMLKRWGQRGATQHGVLLSIIEETLSGAKVIKGFSAEKFLDKHFRSENMKMFHLNNKIIRLRDLSSPLSEVLGIGAVMVVLWLGGSMVLEGKMNLSAETFIAFIVIFSQLISPAKSVSNSFFHIQKGLAAVDRINHILHADILISDPEHPVQLESFQDKIEYKNVSFAYDNHVVLDKINITIPKGKIIALVGPSGSGKTTLVDLLPRFWDVEQGEVLIDGINIKNLQLSDLRKHIGIVTQEAVLFNDTVFNNIAFGMSDVSETKVLEAAKAANAHEFISQMAEGYQTNIGDRGTKLSGGQRQRLTIARAILKNPPILILDEATSALDTESEKLVQEALSKLMQNRTALVIAHRLSTIQNADEILVMQKGKIVEQGNHSLLMQKDGGLYKKLVDLQAF